MSTLYTFLTAEKMTARKLYQQSLKWMESHCGKVTARKTQWGYDLSCDSFSVTFTNEQPFVDYMREDYFFSVEWIWSFEVNVYSGSFREAEQMLLMLGAFLRHSTGDCLLLALGEIPVLKRKDGHVIVDDRNWDSRNVFPYNALQIAFEWGTIPYGLDEKQS